MTLSCGDLRGSHRKGQDGVEGVGALSRGVVRQSGKDDGGKNAIAEILASRREQRANLSGATYVDNDHLEIGERTGL
jgi:hypothetical protein